MSAGWLGEHAKSELLDRFKQNLRATLKAINSDLEVEVRCSGAACVARPHEELACSHCVADVEAVHEQAVAVDLASAIVCVDGKPDAAGFIAASDFCTVVWPVHDSGDGAASHGVDR